jgi:hypothetical protein
MMIIYDNTNFISAPFTSEGELENVVQANAEFIFGPDSIYLPKSLIRTSDGVGTIPDGYVIDLASRRWFLVEAELAAHSVWNHIAPQVAKQIIAASQPASRRALAEAAVNQVKENSSLREKFEEYGIREIDIRQVLAEIFERDPIIGIPIDHVGNDLREWAQTLRNEVKLWVIRKLVEFGNEQNVMYEIPEEYRPALDTSSELDRSTSAFQYYDVTLADLVEAKLLTANQKLFLSYQPRGGERKQYEATILSDGTMEVLGKSFSAPSYAALLCLQNAGSNRESVNGWTSWKITPGGTALADLRERFLTQENAVLKKN